MKWKEFELNAEEMREKQKEQKKVQAECKSPLISTFESFQEFQLSDPCHPNHWTACRYWCPSKHKFLTGIRKILWVILWNIGLCWFLLHNVANLTRLFPWSMLIFPPPPIMTIWHFCLIAFFLFFWSHHSIWLSLSPRIQGVEVCNSCECSHIDKICVSPWLVQHPLTSVSSVLP